jgi:hypothetical protein
MALGTVCSFCDTIASLYVRLGHMISSIEDVTCVGCTHYTLYIEQIRVPIDLSGREELFSSLHLICRSCRVMVPCRLFATLQSFVRIRI